MHRLLALGALLAMGCATQPLAPAQEPASPLAEIRLAPVSAAPPAGPCAHLSDRMAMARAGRSDLAPTWLNAPIQMVAERRSRALHFRARQLGCNDGRG